MDAYTSFAKVYDLFMDDTPYEAWRDFLVDYLRDAHVENGLVLDLGCGTGKLTRLMREAGYDMIGVDNSIEMLDIAREADATDILYLMQDMREFELYGTVAAIYSACDSMNYILEEEDLKEVFRLANNYLEPRGYFFFDMKTPYTYEELLGENTIADNREDSSLIWENYYDEERQINEYDLTLFIREGEEPSFFRFQETHVQRCYPVEKVIELLEAAGMEVVGVYDAYTREPLREDSERMMFIAREKAVEGKVYSN